MHALIVIGTALAGIAAARWTMHCIERRTRRNRSLRLRANCRRAMTVVNIETYTGGDLSA